MAEAHDVDITSPLPRTGRFGGRRVWTAASLLGVGVVGIFLWQRHANQATQQALPTAKPALTEVSGAAETVAFMKQEHKYVGWNRQPPDPPKPPPPPAEPPVPMFQPAAATPLPPLPPVAPPPPPVFVPPPVTPPPVSAAVASSVTPPAASPPKKPVQQERTTFFAKAEKGKSPFDLPAKDGAHPGKDAESEHGQGLLKPATWVQPRRPELVWFQDMVLNGLLMDAVTSDAPGSQVRIKVTRPLEDAAQSGTVLVPQHSVIITTVPAAAARYGQATMEMLVDKLIYPLPSKTILDLRQNKLSDQAGAGGLRAHVDNHYVRLGIGALMTAVLSVGARSVGGNGGGSFQADPALEVSRSVSGQVNQAGQKIVDREMMVPPTLTLEEATPVTLMLRENLSLSRAPKLVD